MALKQVFINVDADTQKQVTDDGIVVTPSQQMRITRSEEFVLCVSFVDVDRSGASPVVSAHPYDVTSTFECAGDDNFDESDSLMFLSEETTGTDNAVNISGDWADADKTQGKISFRINTNTAKFGTVMGTSSFTKDTPFFGINVYSPGITVPSSAASFNFTAVNKLTSTVGAPVYPDPTYVLTTVYTAGMAGKVDSTTFTTAGSYLRGTGTSTYEEQINKFDATVAPTATDDSASGYSVGSRWIDITNDKEYICLDATATSAVWKETSVSDFTDLSDTPSTLAGEGLKSLRVNAGGTAIEFITSVDSDEKVKCSSNDTTAGYLEDKVVASEGINTTNILEITTLNDGADEDVQFQIDESKINHLNLENIGSNSHATIDTHIGSTSNPHGTDIGNLGGGTVAELNTALSDGSVISDKAGEINALTLVTGTTGDMVIIEDASDGFNKKKVNVSDFLAGAGDMLQATYDPANISEQLVGLIATQTLQNKTLTTPTIGDFTNATHNHSNVGNGGTIARSDITGTTSIAEGGTGQTTAQGAIDAISQVSGATNEYVLTKDTTTGNATWKASQGATDDTAWTGTNWTSTSLAPSQNAVETALEEVAVRYADRVSQLTSADDGRLVAASTAGNTVSWTANYAELATLESNLTAYYKMEDVNDAIGSYNLTNLNSTTFTSAKYNNGATFDATNEGLEYADDAAFDFGTTFSVSLWVNGAAQDNKPILTKWDFGNSNESWYISTGPTGSTDKLRVTLSDDGSTTQKDYRSSVTVMDSTWHHVVVTWSSGTLKIYIDGSEDTSVTKTTDNAMTTIYNGSSKMAFAKVYNSGTPWDSFAGQIDEVAISNSYVFTSTEISNLYNSGTGAFLDTTVIATKEYIASPNARLLADIQTTDATLTQIATIAIPEDAVYAVEAIITGRKSDGTDRALYKKTGLFYRNLAGNVTQQGSTADIITPIESNASWDASFSADTGNQSIDINVTGVAATTIDWHVEYKYTKLEV